MRAIGIAVGAGLLAIAASAAGAAPALEEYGKLPAVEQMRISPAGDLIAFIATDGDARKLVIRKAGDATALAVVDAGKLKLRDLVWLDEDHVLIQATAAINVDPGGYFSKGELARSSIFNVKTNKLFNVFSSEPRILHTTYGLYGVAHKNGKTYAYFGGLPLAGSGNGYIDFDNNSGSLSVGHINLYRQDADGGHPELAAGGNDLFGSDWAVDDGGQVVAHTDYDPRKGELRLYDTADESHLVERERDSIGSDIYLAGLGERPGQYLVHQGDAAGGWRLEEFAVGSDDPGKPLMSGLALKYPLFDSTTGLLIGGVTNEDDPKTVLLDSALQAKFDKVRRLFAGEITELVSTTANLDKMVVLTYGPQDSGTYFLIDIPAGKAQALAWRYPGVLPADVGTSRIVAFKAGDGLEMQGVLTLPPGRPAKDLPLVVMPHGGPEARDYLAFDWWAQAFASRGYAVFQPNFRGSDGFGPAFRDAGFGQWGRKMQTDISDGVAELVRQGIVDPKRACIVGASYGGYAALAGVTVQQGLYRCAVSVSGLSDLSRMMAYEQQLYGEASPITRFRRLFLGVHGPGDAALDAISPVKLAGRADAPVLLIHGRDDSVVPIEQSREMRDALQSAHKEVEMLELPSEDHGLSRTATRTQMLNAAVTFVEKRDPAN